MIKYSQTQNNFQEPEIPKPVGYRKQFSIELPRGEEKVEEIQVVEEQPEETQQPIQKPQVEQVKVEQPTVVSDPLDFSDEEMKVLLEDGSSRDKSRVASKYLQKNLGLSKDQAAALIGVWQAESGFNLNAENAMEKAGKSRYVKKDEFGIGIGQWTGARHKNYVNYINNNGGKNNLKTQLDFAINEIQNNYPDYLNNLRSAKTVRDATAYTYAQYVGATERNIKNLDDLYARVRKIENRYADTHKKLYGKAGSGGFERRVKFANESLLAKLGAKLPMMQSGGAFKNFNFDNIYKNSTEQIKALQRELGVKDDGMIGKKTISALQKRVGTKVDGVWGKNSVAAAKLFVNQAVTPQLRQVTAPASSTYVRKPIVPNMKLASDAMDSTEVVPSAAMEEIYEENPSLLTRITDTASRFYKNTTQNPAAELTFSTARRAINNAGRRIFGDDTTLIQGPVKTEASMPDSFNEEMEAQWRWLAEQNPKIRRAGGVKQYFERNPDASIRLAMTNENLAKYNTYKQNNKYGTVTDSELQNIKFNPAATQYLVGRWAGTLTKDGIQINDNYDFGLTDRETERYEQKAADTEGGLSTYAKIRLWAQNHSMQETDPEEWKTK